jgi:hypothetical protein
MVSETDEPRNIATIFLGDRIRLQTIAVRGNEIVLDLIRTGPHDPLCCPTQRVAEHYRLEDSRLARTAVEEVAPADVLSASLFTRFRSRQEHTFAKNSCRRCGTNSADMSSVRPGDEGVKAARMSRLRTTLSAVPSTTCTTSLPRSMSRISSGDARRPRVDLAQGIK